MPIIPAGSPAWSRTADHTNYGGNTEKQNFHGQGVTNARTDVGAENICRLASDLAAASRTAPFATITIGATNDYAWPAAIAVNQMTGVSVVPYRGNVPLLGFPAAAKNGTGDVTITWDPSYDDDYGVSAPVNLRHATIGIRGNTPLVATYELVDANADGLFEAVRIRIFNVPGGAPAVDPGFVVSVWT